MRTFPAPPRVHVLHVPGTYPGIEVRQANLQAFNQQADLCVHEDPLKQGIMWNFTRMISCMAAENHLWTWQLGLSDDAVPIRGWQQHIERACTNSPRPLLGLTYTGKYPGLRAYERGYPYAVGRNVLKGTGIAYHHSILIELADFVARASQTSYLHDDQVVNTFAHHRNQEPAVCTRAIFDVADVKSLVGHGRYGTAAKTIADEGPDWRTKTWLQENVMARRDDDGLLLKLMGITT
jgi:hypothetical protein